MLIFNILCFLPFGSDTSLLPASWLLLDNSFVTWRSRCWKVSSQMWGDTWRRRTVGVCVRPILIQEHEDTHFFSSLWAKSCLWLIYLQTIKSGVSAAEWAAASQRPLLVTYSINSKTYWPWQRGHRLDPGNVQTSFSVVFTLSILSAECCSVGFGTWTIQHLSVYIWSTGMLCVLMTCSSLKYPSGWWCEETTVFIF